MEIFFEILKITIPAVIVFLTAWFLIKKFLDSRLQMKQLELQNSKQSISLPIRLQAYERLSLFNERMNIQSLLLRNNNPELTTGELYIQLMLAIQQEYEHNISQQIYVSDKLWQIIRAGKDDVVAHISTVYEGLDPKAPSQKYADALMFSLEKRPLTGADTALIAIRREAGLNF